MNNYKIYQIGLNAYNIEIVYNSYFFNIDELSEEQLNGIILLLDALNFKDLTETE